MHKQETEVKMPILTLTFIIAWIIFIITMATSFSIKNKHHRETIEIYEEYYVLDEKMDIRYREWVVWYQHFGEEEFYLKFHSEEYLRYLELKKIIGEFKK